MQPQRLYVGVTAVDATRTSGHLRMTDGKVKEYRGVDNGLVTDAILASGSGYSCGIVGRTARCEGNNTIGQLGVGDTHWVPGARDVRLTDVVDIAAGQQHTCARTGSGAIDCWGSNGAGELGTGWISPPTQANPLPSQVVFR